MEDVIRVDTIDQYNKLFGLKTLHPLVSIVDLSKASKWPEYYRFNYGIYCVYLKDTKCGRITYGRKNYDYTEGSIVSFAPGQVARVELDNGNKPSGVGILFHPDLIRGTSLGRGIRHYSFLSYESTEALHLSEQERAVIVDCFNKIQLELEHAIDKHSKGLISKNIELLLDYCMRFYERQFITRILDLAKEWILGTDKTVSEIAFELGFQYPQQLNRIFKKNVGFTPNEYRKFQA